MKRVVTVLFACATVCIAMCPARASGDSLPESSRARVRGISLKFVEVSRDGTFEIGPDERFRKVDANSVLRLSFQTPPLPQELQELEAWQGLIAMTREIRTLQQRYLLLAERGRQLVDAAEPDVEFINGTDSVMNDVRNLFNRAVELKMMTSDELTNVALTNPTDTYRGLIEFMDNRRVQLHQEAKSFADDMDQYRVIVRAFLRPRGAGQRPLHVEGYDNLPLGDYRPHDPLAILPTEEEAERLSAELNAADKVARSIREIQANSGALHDALKNILKDVEDLLEKLAESLGETIDGVPGTVDELFGDDFIAGVAAVNAPGGEATQLADVLKSFGEDWDEIRSLREKSEEIHAMIKRARRGAVPMKDLTGVFGKVVAVGDMIPAAVNRIKAWPERVERMVALAASVAAAATDAELSERTIELTSGLKERVDATFEDLSEQLPQTAEVIAQLAPYFAGTAGMLVATNELGSKPVPVIPRPLDDLRDAEVDLNYTGLVLGDQIRVTFDLRRLDEIENGENVNQPPMVVYGVEATQAGWHRRFSGDVIFTQSASVSSDRFRANAAASVEWHHFKRNSPRNLFNRLDPGFGFHAASLSQDLDQNVEFGVGVNVSVWDGLIRVGYGNNISVSDGREYWFFGFGLISVLEKGKSLGQTVVK